VGSIKRHIAVAKAPKRAYHEISSDTIDIPIFSPSEFSELTKPLAHFANVSLTLKSVWIEHENTYYLLQTSVEPTETDTEDRSRIRGTTSRYLTLSKYEESDQYALIAKVRLPDSGRPELMKVNAHPGVSGYDVLNLIEKTLVTPFNISGFTLHDGSHCRYKADEFSIRRLRSLSGKTHPSIYESHGFKLASFLRKPAGEYEVVTQIPHIATLAQQFICGLPLSTLIDTYVPIVLVPTYQNPGIGNTIQKAINRWGTPQDTVQTLMSRLLEASIHFKAANSDFNNQTGITIPKKRFYSDLNLLLNVFLSGHLFEDSPAAIRDTAQKSTLPPGTGRKAFLVQLALSALNSHIIYERQISSTYTPLSTPSIPTEYPHFVSAIADLYDRGAPLPLTWDQFCQSPKLG